MSKLYFKVREWTSALRKENFALDRQIRAIQREEEKVKRSLKEAAKRGDVDVCKVLAREIVAARKSVNRIHTSKAHLNSVQMSMNHQLGIFIFNICFALYHIEHIMIYSLLILLIIDYFYVTSTTSPLFDRKNSVENLLSNVY